MVFLHPQYSLDQHKQTVSDDIDLNFAMKTIFPETKSHVLSYYAGLSDSALTAVRHDIG